MLGILQRADVAVAQAVDRELASDDRPYQLLILLRGIICASILSEIFPDKKTESMERGRLMGMDRVIADIYSPSDVEAGQKLGEAIFQKLMDTSKFKDALQQARKECAGLDLKNQ